MKANSVANQLGGIFASIQKSEKPDEKMISVPIDQEEPLEDNLTGKKSELVQDTPNSIISDFDISLSSFLGVKRDLLEEILQEVSVNPTPDLNPPSEISFSFRFPQVIDVDDPSPLPKPVEILSNIIDQVVVTQGLQQPLVHTEPELVPECFLKLLPQGESCKNPIEELLAYTTCYHPNTTLVAINDPRSPESDYLDLFLAENPPRALTEDQLLAIQQGTDSQVDQEIHTSTPEWPSDRNPAESLIETDYRLKPRLVVSFGDQRQGNPGTSHRSQLDQRLLSQSENWVTVRVMHRAVSNIITTDRGSVVAALVRQALPDSVFTNSNLRCRIVGIVEDAPLPARLNDLLPHDCRFAEIIVETDSLSVEINIPPSPASLIISRFLATAGSYSVRPNHHRLLALFERNGSLNNFTVANQHASVTILSPVNPRTVNLQRDLHLSKLHVDFPEGWRCLVKLFGLSSKTRGRLLSHLRARGDVATVTATPAGIVFVTQY